MDDITQFLKPKSQDEILQSVLQITDANEQFRIGVFKLKNKEIIELALSNNANPNSYTYTDIDDKDIIKTILTYSKHNFKINGLIYKAISFNLEKGIIDLLKTNKLDPNERYGIILPWSIGFCLHNLTNYLLRSNEFIISYALKDDVIDSLNVAIIKKDNDFILKLFENKKLLRINILSSNSLQKMINICKDCNNIEIMNFLENKLNI